MNDKLNNEIIENDNESTAVESKDEEAVVEESALATENTASGDVSENKENEKKTEDSDKKES